MTKVLRLTDRADKLLSEIARKRKKQQAVVCTKGGIVAEMIIALHSKEVAQMSEWNSQNNQH